MNSSPDSSFPRLGESGRWPHALLSASSSPRGVRAKPDPAGLRPAGGRRRVETGCSAANRAERAKSIQLALDASIPLLASFTRTFRGTACRLGAHFFRPRGLAPSAVLRACEGDQVGGHARAFSVFHPK